MIINSVKILMCKMKMKKIMNKKKHKINKIIAKKMLRYIEII